MVSHDSGRTMAERFEHLRADGYAVRWARVGGPVAICGAPRSAGRRLLSTPKAGDVKGAGTARMAQGKPPWDDLPTNVALLPTPNARDGGTRGTPSREHAERRAADPMRSLNLEDAAALLPTPMANRSGSNRGGAAGRDGQPVRPSLDSVHVLLPTPTTSNAGGNKVNNRGELLLPGIVVRPEVWGKYAEAIALWEHVTGIPAPDPTEPGAKGARRLSPALPEWMMGLPPGTLTDHMGRSDALRAAGNGVVSLAAAAAWKLLTSS
jgi:DNA (cytosine-5)-methyltransferase 1